MNTETKLPNASANPDAAPAPRNPAAGSSRALWSVSDSANNTVMPTKIAITPTTPRPPG